MDCSTGQCDTNIDTTEKKDVLVEQKEDVMNPLTFIPPPFAGAPSITIEFCDRCRWLHRATWIQTELFLTFPPPILKSISLIPLNSPETGGRFRVWLSYPPTDNEEIRINEPEKTGPIVSNELLWDRKTNDGFPELKVL
ncbi:hypothetical protein FRB99_002141, partial [Tulasnella sp. 403]